jgi:uncharacterized protein (DUF983 family)
MVDRRGRFTDHCRRCGHRFEREEGYWLGAVLLNTVVAVVAFAVVLVVMMVATWPDVPWGWVTAGVVSASLVIPIVFYPWAKSLWVALDLTVRPLEDREVIAARERVDGHELA